MPQSRSVPPDDGRYHSPHVQPRPDCERLRWEALWPGAKSARVRSYTCSCRPTFYELCQSGGTVFIRRTRRIRGEEVIDESSRGRPAKVEAVWRKLMTGEVA
ncbi:hypothetical protein SAMN05444920_101153 [Nonomuraea solani]|uniref:Uncharacterized protein n=1 Tax=Nonomuraea solani TaxID=1144553 RepID=A0A1H5TBD5_9ACTN|nr:hypothetical protein [Nonomuraea solani]SEF59371.1 hypothetical protein SAMN05444920_101153 [Nonomuraea solani]